MSPSAAYIDSTRQLSDTSFDDGSRRSWLSNPSTQRVFWLAGGALAVYSLAKRPFTTAAIAAVGGLAVLGTTSHNDNPSNYETEATFAINCSPNTAYAYWHDFENLSRFMRHIKSVNVIDGKRSEWTALGPFESEIYWMAEITEDRPDERIAWRSLPGSSIDNSGSVEFRAASNGRGTFVTVRLGYVPPAGKLGQAAAWLSGKHPQFTVREDLRRFKALIEAGETPTAVGQTHGPRGIGGRVSEALMREKQNQPKPAIHSALGRTA